MLPVVRCRTVWWVPSLSVRIPVRCRATWSASGGCWPVRGGPWAGAAAVVLVGVVLAFVLGRGSTAKKAATTTTTTHAAGQPATCPLTGTPAPGGTVPARPALAVKIGNYTADRPSAGLNQADVVFEEPVEGSYTRLVAVFQWGWLSATVGLAKHPRRALVIPWWFRPLISIDRIFPGLVDWFLKVAFVKRFHKI